MWGEKTAQIGSTDYRSKMDGDRTVCGAGAVLGVVIIAGHNYSSHFACLKDLDVGDEIIFTDAEGREFSYMVSSQQLLDPMEIESLETGDWDLTLFTCTIGGKSRVCVRCERVNE